jgi:hypothetical protein
MRYFIVRVAKEVIPFAMQDKDLHGERSVMDKLVEQEIISYEEGNTGEWSVSAIPKTQYDELADLRRMHMYNGMSKRLTSSYFFADAMRHHEYLAKPIRDKVKMLRGIVNKMLTKRDTIQRKLLEKAIWNRTHKDYKSTGERLGAKGMGKRSILILGDKGTTLMPLCEMTLDRLRTLNQGYALV